MNKTNKASVGRRWLAVLAVGLGLGAAEAQATTYNIGDLTGSAYANVFTFANGAAIDDTFNFTLGSSSSFTGILSSITLSNFVGISNFMLSLTGPGGLNMSFSPSSTASGPVIFTGDLSLPAGGIYAANLTGVATGTSGGIYSAILAAVPAVPEPSEWMMMVAGLALVGFMAKRRSKHF